MSGQLTPGEVRGRIELIRGTEAAAELAVRASLELGDHIDWLADEIGKRDEEIVDLKTRVAELESELAAAYAEED